MEEIIKHKKLSIKEKRIAYFIEGKFEELIATIKDEKINLYKEKKQLDHSTNFYHDYTNNIPIYTKKTGFIIPQEQVVEQFFKYSEQLAIFLLSKHNIPIELSYRELVKSLVISDLDLLYKLELQQKFLSYFENHQKTSKPFIFSSQNSIFSILSIYLNHKEKKNSDSPFFNELIEDVFNTPLTKENVRLKTIMFREVSDIPGYAKQFIPNMNELLTYLKNTDETELNITMPKSRLIKDIFQYLEKILGEEGLLKYVRLNHQTDIFYEMMEKKHYTTGGYLNRLLNRVIANLNSFRQLTSDESYKKLDSQNIFNSQYEKIKDGRWIAFKNNSFFNEKMNMPLPKLKQYFLLLKKTGELEHIKKENIFINLDTSIINTGKIIKVFERVAFLEQFGISLKYEKITNNVGWTDFNKISSIKEDYLLPMVNYLKENHIETELTPELIDSLKEKETTDFAKKFSKIQKELKALMVNTDNLFKRKML